MWDQVANGLTCWASDGWLSADVAALAGLLEDSAAEQTRTIML